MQLPAVSSAAHMQKGSVFCNLFWLHSGRLSTCKLVCQPLHAVTEASGSNGYTCTIVVGILQGHTDTINSIAWSPTGRLIATACDDMEVRLFDIQELSSQNIKYKKIETKQAPLGVGFGNDGNSVVAALRGTHTSCWTWLCTAYHCRAASNESGYVLETAEQAHVNELTVGCLIHRVPRPAASALCAT